MGYDVHITRANHWLEAEASPIPFDAWIDLVKADPEMRLDGYAEAKTSDGRLLRYENAGLAVWTAYSKHGVRGGMAWFDYRDGEVVVKDPDKEIRAKMKEVAAKLGARVIGDEGEEY